MIKIEVQNRRVVEIELTSFGTDFDQSDCSVHLKVISHQKHRSTGSQINGKLVTLNGTAELQKIGSFF